MTYAALLGHGTVGSGVAELMIREQQRVSRQTPDGLVLKTILDLRDFPDLSYADRFTKDFETILHDGSIAIVIEAMGGLTPAYDFVKRSLQAGKSVVTSNKELVAAKGAELLKIAKEKNVNFLFEASVGGGIPILRPMAQCLTANAIESVTGILNGTTNYILNKMIVENRSFEDALKLAQEKGYAERDPAADIEGHDACRKICILASLAFGKHVYPEQVPTCGITEIDSSDILYAGSFGRVVKLIGRAERLTDGRIRAFVRPMLICHENILSKVDGVFNAIAVHGDAVGDLLFYGRGAGKMPTASAVVADAIDCAKHLNTRKMLFWEDGPADYVSQDDGKIRRYIRLKANGDYRDFLTRFAEVFPEDLPVVRNEFVKELAFLTEPEEEAVTLRRVAQLDATVLRTLQLLD